MTFSDYYNSSFRQDLQSVVAAMPPLHDHGDGEVTIQPRTLSIANPVISGWGEDLRMLFAAALFLTILVDEVCYTYFRPAYPRFRALTLYPKLRGDCPGGCWWHAHPELIWHSIGTLEGQPYRRTEDLPFQLLPGDFLKTMEEETRSFIVTQLTDIDPDAFWDRCALEISPVFRLLFLTAKRDDTQTGHRD
jgi:hypothetical protein